MGKSLSELGSASTLSNSDLFLIDSDGVSKSMSVSTLENNMKPSAAGTADKAVADSEEQNIASTYIKALSITDHKLTALNGASSAVQTLDLPDTTYNTGSTATAGITKLYNSTGENTDGTMTQAAITAALAAIDSFDIAVVDQLPTSNINGHCIYLIPGSGNGNNTRDEYIYVNANWEKIGTTVADLSNIKYVSGLTQSGSTVTVTRNNETAQSINTGVMEIVLGNGFTASTLTSTGTISLPTVTTASTAGPTESVTGSEGSTIQIPKVIVDEFGRVTGLTSFTLTNKDTTYSNGTGLDLSNNTFSLSTCVAGDSAGPTSDVTGSNGSTVSIPKLTVDNYGRVTSIGSQTFTAQDHTYTNGNGLNLSNGEFSLANSGATSGTYGPSANVTGSEGNTINVPSLTVDAKGRVTAISNKVYTSKDTTYTPASLGSGYGTCETAAATAAKTVTMSGYELVTGGVVSVKFTNAVPASATMAINSKAAKAIYHKGAAITAGVINAGDTAMFMYDGTYYHLIAIDSSLSVIDCGDEG